MDNKLKKLKRTYSYKATRKCFPLVPNGPFIKTDSLVITRFKYVPKFSRVLVLEVNNIDCAMIKVYLPTLCTNSSYPHQVDENIV